MVHPAPQLNMLLRDGMFHPDQTADDDRFAFAEYLVGCEENLL
jgi:hypothetical protein